MNSNLFFGDNFAAATVQQNPDAPLARPTAKTSHWTHYCGTSEEDWTELPASIICSTPLPFLFFSFLLKPPEFLLFFGKNHDIIGELIKGAVEYTSLMGSFVGIGALR